MLQFNLINGWQLVCTSQPLVQSTTALVWSYSRTDKSDELVDAGWPAWITSLAARGVECLPGLAVLPMFVWVTVPVPHWWTPSTLLTPIIPATSGASD